jgi:hypothetical protein
MSYFTLDMKLLFVHLLIPVLFIITLGLNGINTAAATSASPNFNVFTVDSSPYGSPYSEWVAKWWSWWAGIPIDKHPVKDYSNSERCSVMQSGPVWFLPDIIPGEGKINYNCNIPPGKAILLPITTTFCENTTKVSCGPITTDEELADAADNILTHLNNMEVIVDEIKIDLKGSLVKTGFFNITFPQHPLDIWGNIPPGTYRAIATGYFLFLHNLSPGEHTIELRVVDLLKGNEGPPPRFDPMREASFKIFVN